MALLLLLHLPLLHLQLLLLHRRLLELCLLLLLHGHLLLLVQEELVLGVQHHALRRRDHVACQHWRTVHGVRRQNGMVHGRLLRRRRRRRLLRLLLPVLQPGRDVALLLLLLVGWRRGLRLLKGSAGVVLPEGVAGRVLVLGRGVGRQGRRPAVLVVVAIAGRQRGIVCAG